MRQSAIIFCLSLALGLAFNNVKAQDSIFLTPLIKSDRYSNIIKHNPSGFFSATQKDSVVVISVQSRLPLNFYSTHLGTACKMELQLEKQTGLPIRIRLGSKEQVDYLEGKFSRKQ